MKILKYIYEKTHHRKAPYYYNYSFLQILLKPVRKWAANVLAANCPFNCIRIFLYRLCGFKIGKGTFIGMRCYLDDVCYSMLQIGSRVTISYGVYFACHGRKQGHCPITVEDDAYIGMRASIVSKNAASEKPDAGVRIGHHAVIGACALVNKDIPPYATAVGVPCKIIEKVDNC